MKTAISVPDDAYDRIEAAVVHSGGNRSEFYVRAALMLTEVINGQQITDAINTVVDRSDDDSNATVAQQAEFVLGDEEW